MPQPDTTLRHFLEDLDSKMPVLTNMANRFQQSCDPRAQDRGKGKLVAADFLLMLRSTPHLLMSTSVPARR
jgi:hypothetical protein